MNIAQGPWFVDDLLTFTVTTHRFDTGAIADADAVPAYRVYEDETGTAILTGNMAKLDDANTTGFYSEQITLSAANGFEAGKSYNVLITATIDSVAGGQSGGFKVCGNLPVAVNSIAANAVSASALAADAVTEIQSGLATAAALATVDDFIDTEIGAIQTAIAALNDLSAAEVNAELLDVLNVDTFSEPTGVPPSSNTIRAMLHVLYMIACNGITVTNGKLTVLDAAGNAEFEKDLSDDGTTYAENRVNAV